MEAWRKSRASHSKLHFPKGKHKGLEVPKVERLSGAIGDPPIPCDGVTDPELYLLEQAVVYLLEQAIEHLNEEKKEKAS